MTAPEQTLRKGVATLPYADANALMETDGSR
jgi:hypothetical protein